MIHRSTDKLKETRVTKPLTNQKWFSRRQRGGEKIRIEKEDPTKLPWQCIKGYNRGTSTKNKEPKKTENNGDNNQPAQDNIETITEKKHICSPYCLQQTVLQVAVCR